MKKFLLGAVLALAMVASSFGAPLILSGNFNNENFSPTATTGGRYFMYTGFETIFVPATYASMNISLWGGPDADHLSFLGTLNDGSYYNAASGGPDPYFSGMFVDISGHEFIVPGVPDDSIVTLRQQVWLGSDIDWATAQANNAFRADVTWQNPVGSGVSGPTYFDWMPATILTQTPVPEPGTLTIAGMGAAALLALRRRK